MSTRPVIHGESWTFMYALGTYTYIIATDATIAPISDTTQKQHIPELSQSVTITISTASDIQVINPVAVASGSCDTNVALMTRAQQLIPKVPSHIAIGDHWRDSTSTIGCYGIALAELTVISNYVVISDTTITNTVALQIHRTDSLSANGESAEGQHRIFVAATGTSITDLFVDVTTDRFIGSQSSQTSLINVTTSGRLAQFVQHVTETVTPAGTHLKSIH